MKSVVSVLLCMVLVFSLGLTAMAQTNEADVHYMTDYENLGELFEDLETESFAMLDEDAKEQLYDISIEAVLAGETVGDEGNANQRATATFSGSLSTTALLKGRLTYKATASASTKATAISITGIVYDSSNKIVDTDSKSGTNVTSLSLNKTVTGLVSGEQHKVYAAYSAKFPSGVTPSSSTKTKTAYVDVK